jgi:hypothetical protein
VFSRHMEPFTWRANVEPGLGTNTSSQAWPHSRIIQVYSLHEILSGSEKGLEMSLGL